MHINETKIMGCYEITPNIITDKRGAFIKTFHHEIFKENHLETNFVEQYYSISQQGVLRGLHFQVPPKHHVKLVYCPVGQVVDAVVDLRIDSPTYGQFELFDLNDEKKNMIYIPPGLAHGFCVLSKNAVVAYNVSTVHSPAHDGGIRWNSAGISWPNLPLIVSQKDSELPAFLDFSSPFRYEEMKRQ
ncbi:dTDP-4-dehydrorhamnose 3,5-epimerase [Peribacillus asahii]|uniref:dTDP-4-dehydrorhamnose 3,5-epimerase n=1 Tax=Peribacillus asahii TaxID=228899 RepID=UPI00382F305A